MTLPAVAQSEVVSVRLNGSVRLAGPPMREGEALVFKFPRAEVEKALSPGDHVEVVVSATVDGVAYEGKDEIRVLARGIAARTAQQPGQKLPTRLAVHPNAPNPFNPTTTIRFELPQATTVELAVYAVDGNLVRRLVSRSLPAGYHEATWDGRDERGQLVSSGIYLYRFNAGRETITGKMTLAK
jgi:hypothetical protein